ncbi:MAG TPA: cysteine desulfurase family protein [Thermoanaerobaculia bacterium]|nr:cysteine desulfurase family protein [Thermoanaerobaculia bacterium]HUM30255.1 cysteine desulfurase family protein [Thermoanaerobaculia bacterium]HXK68449.1 cysteine desulfurase family protein [Thermoanaerobaculia bacterium]
MAEALYLDYNATTPVDPEVLDAMGPYLRHHFGNPSSSHPYGQLARKGLEKAREEVADLLGSYPDEIVFNSGGSESNNHAIKGVAFALRERGTHIVTSLIEHPAVLEVCRYLEGTGFRITRVPVDSHGTVDREALRKALTRDTILVSIMHANNEVGTIQPVKEISDLAHEVGILVHTDAAQSVGKIDVSVEDLGVDLLSLAGHKLYAPKGIGVLFVRRGTPLHSLIHGAGHERGRRAGTENVAYIVGLGKACALAKRGLEEHGRYMKEMRDLLHREIKMAFPDVVLNGHPDYRLPNTLSLGFPGRIASDILNRLETELAVSAGAACHGEGVTVSHVLEAMGVPARIAMGTLRFSTGRMTCEGEITRAVSIVRRALQ